MKTNILELITKDKQEISSYLGDVSVEDFIQDIKDLVKNSADKGAIKIAIDKLQELL